MDLGVPSVNSSLHNLGNLGFVDANVQLSTTNICSGNFRLEAVTTNDTATPKSLGSKRHPSRQQWQLTGAAAAPAAVLSCPRLSLRHCPRPPDVLQAGAKENLPPTAIVLIGRAMHGGKARATRAQINAALRDGPGTLRELLAPTDVGRCTCNNPI